MAGGVWSIPARTPMTIKTVGSNRRLGFITQQLQRYIAQRMPIWRKRPAISGDGKLPWLLQAAALRGEAIMRVRFFDWCEAVNMGLTQSGHQQKLWQTLMVERGKVADLVRRIGLIKAMANQTAMPEVDDELAYQLYCGMLDDLARQQNMQLLEIATDQLWLHYFRQLFPDTAVQASPPDDPEALRLRAEIMLAKLTRQTVAIKESFTQSETAATFHLRIKLDGKWQDQPTITATRLKPARLQAWQALITQLETGKLDAQA